MEPNQYSNVQPHSKSKDLILNLGAIITLYTAAGALLNILFTVIDKAYPAVGGYGYYSSSSISFPVALLIVVFPIYLLLMWALDKNNMEGGAIIGIRKFFLYVTIGISGGLIAGNLITILYRFIDGQELTASFLFKVLSLSSVALVVFAYYIADVYGKILRPMGKISAIAATVVVGVVVVIAFSVIGSPRTQRLVRYDEAKISALQEISRQIEYFSERNKRLPTNLKEIESGYSYGISITDSQTNVPYEYRAISASSYELCAVFNSDAQTNSNYKSYYGYNSEMWGMYKKGRYCFTEKLINQPVPDVPIPVNINY